MRRHVSELMIREVEEYAGPQDWAYPEHLCVVLTGRARAAGFSTIVSWSSQSDGEPFKGYLYDRHETILDVSGKNDLEAGFRLYIAFVRWWCGNERACISRKDCYG